MSLTESEFLQGSATRLGIQGEDDAKLKDDPATVNGEIAPLDGTEGNRVDICGEEPGELSKDLLNTDTSASLGIGPEFDKVGWTMVR